MDATHLPSAGLRRAAIQALATQAAAREEWFATHEAWFFERP
ncbi:hypothetical protein [Prosthecobacter sp.]